MFWSIQSHPIPPIHEFALQQKGRGLERGESRLRHIPSPSVLLWFPDHQTSLGRYQTASNYTLVDYEAAANTYITNVNPVFMGALGQTAGTESKLYQKYSHKLTEKLKDVYLDGFAEFVKYLSPTKWLSEVSNASLTGTLNGYNFTAESFAKQHSHYYITEALGACTYYESTSTECTSYGYCGYVGYCTMEDFYLYYYETNVAPAMFGGVTCTVYYNTTCTYTVCN